MCDDDTQTMTIDGQVYTLITSEFVEEAEGLIAALVKKGVPGKLRPGRGYIIRRPDLPENTREARRKHRRAIGLGICEIWLVGEIEEADQTHSPSPPTV